MKVLMINGSPRPQGNSELLCQEFRRGAEAAGHQVEEIALREKVIHPCKACFSTAAALCHWPCSCYPNYALGQVHDWMNEIYPMWVEAHGVMIITPVNSPCAPAAG